MGEINLLLEYIFVKECIAFLIRKKIFLQNKKSLKQLKSIIIIEILGTIQTVYGFATYLINVNK